MSESPHSTESQTSSTDAAFYEAVGRVTAHSAFLEYTVGILLHGLAGLDQRRGRIVAPDNFDRQLSVIRELTRLQVSDDELLERVDEWARRAKSAYQARNQIVHGAWAGTARLPKRVGGEMTTWTVADIEVAAFHLANVQREMNQLIIDLSQVTPGPWAVLRSSDRTQKSPPQHDAETGSI